MPARKTQAAWRRALWSACLFGQALFLALPATAAELNDWSFSLPTLDGDRFIDSASLAGPVLVNFWGKDCVPCITEMPRLEAFARANPTWTVLLVATDPPEEARRFLEMRSIALPALRAGQNVAGLMRSAGNRMGALPFSVMLDGKRACRTKLGEITPGDLEEFRKLPCRESGGIR